MEFEQITNILFKAAAIVLSLIYLTYTLVVSKQVKIMTKTLEDKFNFLVIFISSLEITVAFILLIFSIFLT